MCERCQSDARTDLADFSIRERRLFRIYPHKMDPAAAATFARVCVCVTDRGRNLRTRGGHVTRAPRFDCERGWGLAHAGVERSVGGRQLGRVQMCLVNGAAQRHVTAVPRPVRRVRYVLENCLNLQFPRLINRAGGAVRFDVASVCVCVCIVC